MASLNPWHRLRAAWRYHLQTQREILSAQQATLEGPRSRLRSKGCEVPPMAAKPNN